MGGETQQRAARSPNIIDNLTLMFARGEISNLVAIFLECGQVLIDTRLHEDICGIIATYVSTEAGVIPFIRQRFSPPRGNRPFEVAAVGD